LGLDGEKVFSPRIAIVLRPLHIRVVSDTVGTMIERASNVEVGWCEIHRFTDSLSPLQLQGEPFILRFPRVETLG
jgi:hypothetical protein